MASLQAQIDKIDAMSKESVYADPIRKLQEQHYEQLVSLRNGYFNTVKEMLEMVENGATGSTQGA